MLDIFPYSLHKEDDFSCIRKVFLDEENRYPEQLIIRLPEMSVGDPGPGLYSDSDKPYEQCRNGYHAGGSNAQHFLTCAEQKKDLLVTASFGFASKEVNNEEQQDQIIHHDHRHPRNSW